jgi:tetratricopeptide (TPR) repeat protein
MRQRNWAVVAALGMALAPGWVFALEPGKTEGWRKHHDAGWKAYQEGRIAEAETSLRAAEAIARTFPPRDPSLATTFDHLAWVFFAQDKTDEAESLARWALRWRDAVLPADHPDLAASLNTMACLYDAQGKYDEAEPLYRRSLEIEEKISGPEHPNVAAILDNLGTVHHNLVNLAEAERLYRRALAIREKIGVRRDLAPTLYNLAILLLDKEADDEAEALFKRSLEIRRETLGPEHPEVAEGLEGLGSLYAKQGKDDAAEPLLKQAVAVFEKAIGANHPRVAACLVKLAKVHCARGDHARAEPLGRRALGIFETTPGPPVLLGKLLEDYAALLRDRDRSAEAAAIEARVRAVRKKEEMRSSPRTAQVL